MWANSQSGLRARHTSQRSGLHTSIGGLAADCLTLPELPKKLAQPLKTGEANHSVICVAESMLAAGLLRDEPVDLPLADLVTNALTEWMGSIWGKPLHLGLGASLVADAATVFDLDSSDFSANGGLREAVEEAGGLDPSVPHLCLLVYATGRSDILIGECVERLEASHPGLGFEVARAIEDTGRHFGVLTSAWIEHVAQMSQWGGMDDETEFCESMGESDEAYEGVTKEELDLELPSKRWRTAKPLSESELQEIAATDRGEAQAAASLILSIRKVTGSKLGFSLGDIEQELDLTDQFDGTALIGWKRFDLVYRVCDDYASNQFESGLCEPPGLGIMLIPLNDPTWFERTKQAWQPSVAALHAVDGLLQLVEQKHESH